MMVQNYNGNGVDGGGNTPDFNLKEFVFKYLRYIPIIAFCVLIALIFGFIKIRYTTPTYKVSGALFINKERKSSGGAREGIEDMFLFSNNVNLNNEQEILHSRQLVARVVKNLGLQLNYYNIGKVRSTNIYGAMPFNLEIIALKDSASSFSFEIETLENKFKFLKANSFINYGEIFETANGVFKLHRLSNISLNVFASPVFAISYRPLEQATIALANSINVSQNVEQATILGISIETDNTDFGKDVVNALMKEYGRMNVEDKKEISRVTMQFIDERLDTIKDELGTVETGLLKFRQSNNVIDLPEQSKLYYTDLAENNKQLIEQQVRLSVIDYLINYINKPENLYTIVPTDLGIEEPVLLPLLAQYNQLLLQRANMIQTTGPSNQALVLLNVNIQKIREQMLEALKNVKHSYSIAYTRLMDQLNLSKSNIRSVPSKAKNLLDIERQQKIKQDLYLFLLQKREEAAISAAATVSNSKPLEDATASRVPVQPNKKNIYIIAFLIGLAIPIAVIALIEFLNDKITEKQEIGKKTQAPIVGEIGHAGNEALVVKAGSRTVVSEQFRILRTNIQYLIHKIEKPVLLITSSVSGEGKSFIATNVGAVMALTGKKTVILELDIRKPRLLKGLGIKASKGLTNYILGNAAPEEIIVPVEEIPNLFVIACGPIPPNPSELLLDGQVDKLFEFLKATFDAIIIDTAPVGLVSDGFTLSKYADACLYIVRQGYTLRKQLNMIEELYQKKRLPNMALLVNDIKTKGRYKGYYGYGGGIYGSYGYGYGYGYGEYFQQNKEPKKKFLEMVKFWK